MPCLARGDTCIRADFAAGASLASKDRCITSITRRGLLVAPGSAGGGSGVRSRGCCSRGWFVLRRSCRRLGHMGCLPCRCPRRRGCPGRSCRSAGAAGLPPAPTGCMLAPLAGAGMLSTCAIRRIAPRMKSSRALLVHVHMLLAPRQLLHYATILTCVRAPPPANRL